MTLFLDTNILIYSVSDHADERRKRDTAANLIDTCDCVLSIQVLQEFYHQVTRPSRSTTLPVDIARGFVMSWMRFPVVENTSQILLAAIGIAQQNKLSIWDALIVAAAQEAGCDRLLTEDLSHGQRFSNLRVENPFR